MNYNEIISNSDRAILALKDLILKKNDEIAALTKENADLRKLLQDTDRLWAAIIQTDKVYRG